MLTIHPATRSDRSMVDAHTIISSNVACCRTRHCNELATRAAKRGFLNRTGSVVSCYFLESTPHLAKKSIGKVLSGMVLSVFLDCLDDRVHDDVITPFITWLTDIGELNKQVAVPE